MTRHLIRCEPSQGPKSLVAKGGQKAGGNFHLVIEGRYAKNYWLHVAVPAKASLRDLDSFLRQIWLECCGHMSAFSIQNREYTFEPDFYMTQKSMAARVGKVLEPGVTFSYEYDFGSTTELMLKVVDLRPWDTEDNDIQVLARNDPPGISCDACQTGKLATQICSDCQWSGKGWLCDDCAKTHNCGKEMLLPVVNSPRAGVCGYSG